MRFRGQYHFLSNFYPCKIIAWGIEFSTAEHVYVAAKTFDMNLRKEIARITTPGGAKRVGRNIELRPDWKEVRVSMMESILRRKFEQPDLRTRLLEIEGAIIEHNQWHDNFWGVCQCGKGCSLGQNVLGILLMALREDLR
jgi:hypothetical protein